MTHASDDFKLHNGGRIIEIQIESEKDIDKIICDGFIESLVYKREAHCGETNEYPKTKFYGFKSEDHKNTQLNQVIEISRYILYPSGKSQCYRDVSRCKSLSKVRKNSLMEMSFHTSVGFDIYEMAKYQGYKMFGIKNCLYCKNYVDSYSGLGKLCRRYKYLGINRWEQHDTARAKECSCFILNEEEMSREVQHFNSLHTNEYSILTD